LIKLSRSAYKRRSYHILRVQLEKKVGEKGEERSVLFSNKLNNK